MQCPVCHGFEHSDTHLECCGFNEDLIRCAVCETVWSVNHGLMEIVTETQNNSFLSAHGAKVDGDDLMMV